MPEVLPSTRARAAGPDAEVHGQEAQGAAQGPTTGVSGAATKGEPGMAGESREVRQEAREPLAEKLTDAGLLEVAKRLSAYGALPHAVFFEGHWYFRNWEEVKFDHDLDICRDRAGDCR